MSPDDSGDLRFNFANCGRSSVPCRIGCVGIEAFQVLIDTVNTLKNEIACNPDTGSLPGMLRCVYGENLRTALDRLNQRFKRGCQAERVFRVAIAYIFLTMSE